MPHFAANLTMMFNEVAFLDRFEAAAKAGFTAVEFLFPYEHAPDEVGKRLKANGRRRRCSTCRPAIGRRARRALRRCRSASTT